MLLVESRVSFHFIFIDWDYCAANVYANIRSTHTAIYLECTAYASECRFASSLSEMSNLQSSPSPFLDFGPICAVLSMQTNTCGPVQGDRVRAHAVANAAAVASEKSSCFRRFVACLAQTRLTQVTEICSFWLNGCVCVRALSSCARVE